MTDAPDDHTVTDPPVDAPERRGRRHVDDLLDVHRGGAGAVRRDVSAGVKWLGTSQVISQVVRIAMTITLGWMLTPDEFGIVALVMVVTGLFDRVLGDTGTGSALVQHPKLSHGLASSVLWLNIVVGVLTAAGFVVLGGPIADVLGDSAAAPLVRVVGLAAVLGGLGHVQRAVLRRKRKFKGLAAVNLSNAVVTAIATIGFAMLDWKEWALVIGNLAGTAFSVALAWALSGWRPAFHYSRAEVRQIRGFSANLSIQNLFGYVSFAGDRFVIGRFIGTTELGYYGLANRLMRYPLQTSAQTYREVVFPTLARVQDDHPTMLRAYRRTLEGITLLIIPLCFAVTALARPLVEAVLGPKWIPATDVVRIMTLVSALQALTTTTGSLFLAKGRADLSLRWQIGASAVLMICYSVGAIWGVTGVAWGFFVGVALLTYPSFWLSLRLIDARPGQVLVPLLPTFAAAGVGSAVGYLVVREVSTRVDGPWPPLLAGSACIGLLYLAYVALVRPPAYRDLTQALRRRRRTAVA